MEDQVSAYYMYFASASTQDCRAVDTLKFQCPQILANEDHRMRKVILIKPDMETKKAK